MTDTKKKPPDMINIFGKLYTLLRRPQPGETNQAGATSQTDSKETGSSQEPASKELEQVASADSMTASSEFVHIFGPADANESGTNIDIPHRITDDGKADDTTQPEKDSDSKLVGNQTLDLDELKKLVDEMSGADVGAKTKEQPKVTEKPGGEEPTGTDDNVAEMKATVDAVAEAKEKTEESKAETGKEESNEKKSPTGKKEKQPERKVCQYFRRGQKCWKGRKCPLEHTRKDERSHGDGPADEETQIQESDFESYSDFVAEMTAKGKLVTAKDLLYKLGYQKGVTTEAMGQAVIGQYNVAVDKHSWYWVKDARYFAEMFFSDDWIHESLPLQGQSGKPKKPKQKKHAAANAGSELTREVCRDFRIKENPNINVYTGNAAGDGDLTASDKKNDSEPNVSSNGNNVSSQVNGHGAAADNGIVNGKDLEGLASDCTEQVLKQAMKQAMQDGLSESLIMEVIDDVTSVETPRKKGKLAKVDLSRTPQKRPEQLALGFNYHADVLVQQSPKTIKGGIICLDNLPPPKEPVDQIAFGFNYHADKLVKESPVSATGEVLVPGIPNTPTRKARDQLALGFNYHADLLAQSSAVIEDDDIVVVSKENKAKPEINGNQNDFQTELVQQESLTDSSTPKKSAKRSINDMFAVGFSYNSNVLIKQSLDEVNGNLPNGNIVSSIIEDANLNENRNLVEITVDDVPSVNTPAGSVW